ncbi:putative 4''-mycarosyl isovaleryl-CoA transferase [uncultured Pleomorphomonas sp.]|uniref:Putative 4''-mycarosyl isovaleryl-CoA transferase n=1 Tax=uncultured Pleomorphomonas sp. TaxID=442121 RepID=A0A212LIQ5_9HYPH|nr:acyltransferase [uncultured Pleomorphomonas sp.]SCM77367.1 putative 4''-mycarosyl isovaleryl-CoA transferase [uncultured Pleomorphomonas sp.]
MQVEARPRLLGLEFGRFLAALLVCCFHFSIAFENLRHDRVFDFAFRAGHAGVDYFFVLSGFIIYWVHSSDIGRPSAAAGFAARRILRIYPLYLAIFAAMLLAFTVVPSLRGPREFSFWNGILDALLLPLPGDGVVPQAWSLRHEMVFYALFALMVLNVRVGIVALAAWQALSLVIGAMHPYDLAPAIKPFFYIYNLGFGIGVACAWAVTRISLPKPGLVAGLAGLGFIAAMAAEWYIGRDVPENLLPLGGIASPLIYMGCAALLILSVSQIEFRKPLPFGRLMAVLGGSSYCIYLIHAPLGSVLIRLFGVGPLAELPNRAVFVAMVAITIAVSIGTHLLVEKPVLKWLRRPRRHPQPAEGIAA